MPRESEAWYDDYGAPAATRKRTAQHRRKLARLGLPDAELRCGPVLDVACGFGETLRLLAERGYRRLAGVDLHTRALERDGFDYLVASADALPFADGSFRLVTCLHSLHHFGELAVIERFLHEAARVLQPGGCLALIDHHDSLQLRLAIRLICAGCFPFTAHLRHLRRQLREERAALGDFFTDWSAVERAIRESGAIEPLRLRKGLFFFYYLGRKR